MVCTCMNFQIVKYWSAKIVIFVYYLNLESCQNDENNLPYNFPQICEYGLWSENPYVVMFENAYEIFPF